MGRIRARARFETPTLIRINPCIKNRQRMYTTENQIQAPRAFPFAASRLRGFEASREPNTLTAHPSDHGILLIEYRSEKAETRNATATPTASATCSNLIRRLPSAARLTTDHSLNQIRFKCSPGRPLSQRLQRPSTTQKILIIQTLHHRPTVSSRR